MKKAKHEPTTKRLTVLLLKLQDFQFNLKYMQKYVQKCMLVMLLVIYT